MADTGTPCQLAIADHPSTQWCFTVYDVRGSCIRSASDSSSGCATNPSTRSRRNTRRSISCNVASWRRSVCLSVMTGKSSPVPPGEHGAQRGGIHHEHEDDVHDREPDEGTQDPEVPITCRLESAEQCSQPGELGRLVDREAGEHRERAQHNHAGVRELLEWVVLALRWVLPTEMEVVLRHLEGARNVPRPEQQGALLAAPHEIS